MMPRQAEKPNASIFSRSDERLECAAAAKDELEVCDGSQIVELP